ncbi:MULTISPECIES: 3-deoxy-D-manno-octulosonic acid kinase [Pseudoxanthomonas]|uniref:3-deoxy-D-manno-octulosonic acid kinase n=1 Tax=Pseudoxanthomonas winnipegensis TaxID=2480810 RepID=A0A4Q9TD83_9GAMM|nr:MULTISPECIES: 3-deoxy-D-manno-octulosonic acid kinase [Pseudoxanthomonas]MDQ1119727.1 3-deoxy-D-manno-octulosonic acid kinase [Pseudoxanthomonas winnipegensis]MDQ1132925.1 3-deoxy-D-manno-octulosonic acid kinase [Pseudoxanthomonas winnipegensis]MDR6137070.1 3-deoxy-D-manno-octulosonic acid kinase [Pseudoxanthomonas sp. SORGH_AS_0997]RZZ85745.1 3-deoxy-D-manno-octulosonic acid kinase [Pseudoxanthomonas winnipegensis]TAA35934.1 3-deoxy-D-manno-octulosonic acid kinase [Pseudoxanthomonas winnip
MAAFDATEVLMPYRDARGDGAILFDRQRLRQAQPEWLDPAHWGDQARPVDSGGRGGAWFVDAPFGQSLLRQYKRGGLAASVSSDRYLWRGANRTRSFAEFRLTRALHRMRLPVPQPFVARYLRQGLTYRAAILMERLADVRSLADRYQVAGQSAPLEETGRLIARFHRAGLDHADLNAHNILFDAQGRGWLIDFDRGVLRIPATRWREANLARLLRSLMKLRGQRSSQQVQEDFARLRKAYDRAWERGF